MSKSDLGLIGLAVMGQNLVLNMNDHGHKISVYNRTVEKVNNFINGAAKDHKNITGTMSIEEFVKSLKRPRRVMLLVKAGKAVDDFIDKLIPHLEQGDIIIDGGNSNFHDTIRRTKYVEDKGLLYIGTGVSGGEEGARKGPSIMPGGSLEAWQYVKDIFQDVSAKAEGGEACCDWVGENGAGHFVKMVHNGIEYGDMQLICEAYFLMKSIGMDAKEISKVFGEWNKGVLDSYLIEITRDILSTEDDKTGKPMVDVILDTAGQKGTGKWTAITSLELGQPLTLIGEAVFSRFLSALKDERLIASKILSGPQVKFDGDKEQFIKDIHDALYASKIVSYAQGYQLMRSAAKEYGWNLNYGGIALMWRGGCIIRSQFLGKIKNAYEKNAELEHLFFDDYFKNAINNTQAAWRKVISKAIEMGVPVPAFSTALSYYDGYRSERLPANLLQGQRDYFGAHTYERTDKPRGEFFHTKWTDESGDAISGSYDA